MKGCRPPIGDEHAVHGAGRDAEQEAPPEWRRTIGAPAAISCRGHTAAMAAVGPTDRSMPPAMMTSVMPSATQALIEDCCRMLRRLALGQEVRA